MTRSLLQGSISTGAGYQWIPGRDLVALAFNWGRPNETTFGPGLDDQYTVEGFWRWQVGEQLAVTPDLQLLVNPALNPNADAAFVGTIEKAEVIPNIVGKLRL